MQRFGLKVFSRSVAMAVSMAGLSVAEGFASTARSDAPTPGLDPISLYGPEIEFEVLRNGDAVGFHRVEFTRKNGEIVVGSTFDVEIDFLFFTAYRYLYTSVARWRDGRMVGLTARVDDDGEVGTVNAVGEGDRLWIRGPRGEAEARGPLFPTNHWNHRVVGQDKVLNTLNGKVTEVSIEPRGREKVETEQGPVMATRYEYVGEIETEVWYDDKGRWVRMRFPGSDGSVIDYRCTNCQGGEIAGAAR